MFRDLLASRGPSDFVCNRGDLRVHDWESWAGEDYSDDYEH